MKKFIGQVEQFMGWMMMFGAIFVILVALLS